MKSLIFVLFAFVCACSTGPKKIGNVVDEKIKNEQDIEIKSAMQTLEAGEFGVAEEKFRSFLSKNPVSIFTTQAKFYLGRSIESQGRHQEALDIYRELAAQARTNAPDFAGLAYFRMSYCYEALGDETKVFSSLVDAMTFSNALPKEIVEIEIPARRAASWMRRGDVERAKAELVKVDRAFPGIFPPNDPATLKDQARILYSAGELSLEPLKPETFMSLIQTHEELQIYLWRAVLTKIDPDSDRARKKLAERYGTFMATAMSYKDPSKKQQNENRKQWMAAVLKSLQTLRNYAGEAWSQAPQELVAAMATVEMQANQTLWAIQDSTPLTPEAKNRSPKKEGRVISKPFFPNEKAEK